MNIAFIGRMGAGKTTLARRLEDSRGYVVKSFADPLRDVVGLIWGNVDKRDPRTRVRLQEVGQMTRQIDANCWVDYMDRWLGAFDELFPSCHVAIDDVRQLNEAQMLRKRGFVLIYLDCPVEIRKQRLIQRDGYCDEKRLWFETEQSVDTIVEILADRVHRVDASKGIDDVFEQLEDVLEQAYLKTEREGLKSGL
jgi:dephospho-CoA kinase